MQLSLATVAHAIDIDNAVADGETARAIVIEALCKFFALDAPDVVTVVANLITARPVVGNAFVDR